MSTPKTLLAAIAVASTVTLSFEPANAVPLPDADDLDPGSTLIDFQSVSAPVSNPLTISTSRGDVTFSSPTILRIVDISIWPVDGDGDGPLALPIVQGKTLSTDVFPPGSDDDHRAITITFQNPVSAVGLGWFDPSFTGNRFQAFNSMNEEIENFVIPDFAASDPLCSLAVNGISACYVGALRSSADISKVVLTPSASNDIYSIDNLFFVPEPTTVSLLGTGFLLLGLMSRRPTRRCS